MDSDALERHNRRIRPLEVSSSAEELLFERGAGSNGSVAAKLQYDGSKDVIPLYDGREALLYFDFLFRFWIYWDTVAHTVSYFSAFGFFVGGMCFIVGTFAALSPAVQALQVPLSCGRDGYSWWTAFPYLLGDILWIIACTLQVFEALNTDYDERLKAWEAGDREGDKPRYRWIGIRLKSFDWWGAVNYDVGVAMYLTAQIFTYVSLCPGTQLSNDVYTICIDYFFLVAGILFFLAGVFYIAALGSPWILPNVLLPFDRRYWSSMMWWALWLYFWGGVGFFGSGIFLYWRTPNNMKLSLTAYQIETSIGFGGGSFLFMLGALLLLMRQSRGRCRPSFSALATNCDRSVHGDAAYESVGDVGDVS